MMSPGRNHFTNLRVTMLRAVLGAMLGALLVALPASAQDEANSTDPDDPSRETDISEDNYRRYMELKDPRLERPAFPTTVYKPPSSLQKMAQLPESSQKHLRNQLRGIIVQSGPWTPQELQREYRFTPSAEAQRDASLLRAEAEAWAELVGEYHEREAESLAASSAQGLSAGPDQAQPQGSPGQAGMGNTDQPPGTTSENAGDQAMAGGPQGNNAGQPGNGQDQANNQSQSQDQGQGQGQGQNQSEDGQGQSRNGSSSSSNDPSRQAISNEWQDPDSAPPEGMSTEGVEQSASELLRERGLARDNGRTALPGPVNQSISDEDNGRWGPEYRTMLPPPVSDNDEDRDLLIEGDFTPEPEPEDEGEGRTPPSQ